MNGELRTLLRHGEECLRGSDTPSLDASLLLGHVLGMSRLELLVTDRVPDTAQTEHYLALLAERAAGTPVAYLLGYRDFWKHRFRCDPRALIPRPETELLVQLALEWGDRLSAVFAAPIRALDHCTGSGCVGLSLAVERPTWQVTLADISPQALSLASENAALLGTHVTLVESDLFDRLEDRWHLVVANPPYLSPEETARCLAQGWGEPALALDGGPGGTALIERLLAQARAHLEPGGVLLWEADPRQHETFTRLAEREGWSLLGPWVDLGGNARVWGVR